MLRIVMYIMTSKQNKKRDLHLSWLTGRILRLWLEAQGFRPICHWLLKIARHLSFAIELEPPPSPQPGWKLWFWICFISILADLGTGNTWIWSHLSVTLLRNLIQTRWIERGEELHMDYVLVIALHSSWCNKRHSLISVSSPPVSLSLSPCLSPLFKRCYAAH